MTSRTKRRKDRIILRYEEETNLRDMEREHFVAMGLVAATLGMLGGPLWLLIALPIVPP